jgi:hypothetical protein
VNGRRDKGSTHEQAAGFAETVVQEHRLPLSRPDPYNVAMVWLLPRIGKA